MVVQVGIIDDFAGDRLFAEHAGLRRPRRHVFAVRWPWPTRINAYSSCRTVSDTEATASRKAVVCEASLDSGANPNSAVGLCSPRWGSFIKINFSQVDDMRIRRCATDNLSLLIDFIDHMLQLRAYVLCNLAYHDMSDRLHGSDGIDCSDFDKSILVLLHNNVTG